MQATNYSADANTDDGSCEYDCEVVLDTSMDTCWDWVWNFGYTVADMISFGYDCTCVEEPVPGCMDETAVNYNPDATLDDGSCQLCTDLAIVCDGGSWQSEVSWDILDADGNVVATGGAPFSGTACLGDGCYTVNMYDSYGDGWTGNVLTVGDFTFTGPAGGYPDSFEGIGVFGVNADCNLSLIHI